ncbi:hypothetical protein Anapl_11756 [Anas platyrhynchos]|uniref:Uncharacterized protein n=1 Tax=Anas platyrhynchos TaxID=8839 RepID=R0JKQ7_ANAPL|nr:hypothetical protein Anapl_11756 [Anas platyrhynchos]
MAFQSYPCTATMLLPAETALSATEEQRSAFSISCSIPSTPQLLDVQWFTPHITAPAGRVGAMCINCMHTPLSLAVPALLKSSPVYWRIPHTLLISFTCIHWQAAGKAPERGEEQRVIRTFTVQSCPYMQFYNALEARSLIYQHYSMTKSNGQEYTASRKPGTEPLTTAEPEHQGEPCVQFALCGLSAVTRDHLETITQANKTARLDMYEGTKRVQTCYLNYHKFFPETSSPGEAVCPSGSSARKRSGWSQVGKQSQRRTGWKVIAGRTEPKGKLCWSELVWQLMGTLQPAFQGTYFSEWMRCLLDAASRLALAMTANRSPIWDFLAKIRAALSCSHFCPGSDPCQQPPDDGCMLPPPQGNPCAKDLLSTLPLKEHCWISKTEEHSSRREIVSPFSSCMSRPGKAWALHQYQRQFDAETGAESNRPTVQTRVIRKGSAFDLLFSSFFHFHSPFLKRLLTKAFHLSAVTVLNTGINYPCSYSISVSIHLNPETTRRIFAAETHAALDLKQQKELPYKKLQKSNRNLALTGSAAEWQRLTMTTRQFERQCISLTEMNASLACKQGLSSLQAAAADLPRSSPHKAHTRDTVVVYVQKSAISTAASSAFRSSLLKLFKDRSQLKTQRGRSMSEWVDYQGGKGPHKTTKKRPRRRMGERKAKEKWQQLCKVFDAMDD